MGRTPEDESILRSIGKRSRVARITMALIPGAKDIALSEVYARDVAEMDKAEHDWIMNDPIGAQLHPQTRQLLIDRRDDPARKTVSERVVDVVLFRR